MAISRLEPIVVPLSNSAEILARLRRAERELREIRRMYQMGRPCPEILDRLLAARANLQSLGRLVVEDHAEECMEPVVHESLDEARAAQLLLAIRRVVTET